MTKSPPAFRLAMRVEGDWWVAYMARPNTMDGAHELGRVLMAVVQDLERKDAFIGLMTSFLEDALKEGGFGVASWSDQEAPEHERSGRA